jgi:1,2-phenylacetyl-CoA epoxidase PaaB subunit
MAGYLVFARDDFEQALQCTGEIEAPDDETARQQADGASGAVEKVLVPREAAHWVVRPAVGAESGA